MASAPTAPTGFAARIIQRLLKFGSDSHGTANPDAGKTNHPLLAEAFMWDTIEGEAHRRSEAAWAKMEKEGYYDPDSVPPGTSSDVLLQSGRFAITAMRTKPKASFDADVLAQELLLRYKVPLHVTKELVDKAKVPKGKGALTVRVVERSGDEA